MPKYNPDRLGREEFENLVQALLKEIIGAGTITFGSGPDAGRMAAILTLSSSHGVGKSPSSGAHGLANALPPIIAIATVAQWWSA